MAQSPEPAPEPIGVLLERALAVHGEDVVRFAWQTFTIPMLRVAQAITDYNALMQLAKRNELSADDVGEAIALVACLRGAADPHKAWMAGELLNKNCKDAKMVLYALQGQPAGVAEN